jgi:hypothetical protein
MTMFQCGVPAHRHTLITVLDVHLVCRLELFNHCHYSQVTAHCWTFQQLLVPTEDFSISRKTETAVSGVNALLATATSSQVKVSKVVHVLN